MSFVNTFKSFQENLDSLVKRRDELQRGDSDGEVQDRVSNAERLIYHLITRVDKIENTLSKKNNNNAEELLSSYERMMREALQEMTKQQNTIDRLRQEVEEFKRNTPPKPVGSTIKTDTRNAAMPISYKPQPQMPTTTTTTTTTSTSTSAAKTGKRPAPLTNVRPSNKQTATKSRPRDDDEHSGSDEDEHKDVTAPSPLPVEFPPGWNRHSGRRASVFDDAPTAESNPQPRTVIIKPEGVKRRIRSVITNNILMKNLEEDQIEELIDEMFEVKLSPNEIIIRQGDPNGDSFYVIDSGELYILYHDEVVATIGSGKSFGEIALMYNVPRTATVKAKTDCVLWGMSRQTFRRCLMEDAIRKRKLYDSFLAQVPLLEGLLPYERSIISDALELRTYREGDTIIRQGDRGDNFYILERGRAIVTKNGSSQELKVYNQGDYFGELALLNDQPRAANVIASGNVRVLCLSRDDFSNLQPCEEVLKRNAASYLSAGAAPATQTAKPIARTFNVAFKQFNEEEAAYVRDLNILVKDFLKPLRQNVENDSVNLSEDDVANLFSNIEMILQIHSTLAHQLSEIKNLEGLAEVISKVPFGLFYPSYLQNWKTACQILDDKKTVDTFNKFLKDQSPHDLQDLLSKPTKRIVQYISFLKEVNGANHPQIASAIDKLTQIQSSLDQ